MSARAKISLTAASAGAFVAAGLAARIYGERHRLKRRHRRGENIEFGSVHSGPIQVEADDGILLNVEIDEADVTGPTIIFLHGWMCTLDTWHYQRLALRGRARMVFVDHRSHGDSQRSTVENSTLAQLAQDVRAVIEQTTPHGDIVLVGHSMGGMTIMALAEAYPELFGDRITGVMLMSTSAGEVLRRTLPLARLGPLLNRTGRLLDAGRNFNSYSVLKRWGLGPAAAERHVDMTDEMLSRQPAHVLLDFYPAFLDLNHYGVLDVFAKVRTVVLCGTKDLLTSVRHSRRLADAIDGSQLITVEDAGHMVMFEENEVVSAAIEELYESLS